MTYQPIAIDDDVNTLSKLSGWVTSEPAQTLETVAFRSGASLTILDQLVSAPSKEVPRQLLANRLAMNAAIATSKLEGRMSRETDIRDAYHLTPAGEVRGPDGDLLAFWRDAARVRLTGRDWHIAVNGLVGSEFEMDVDRWLQSAASQSQSFGPLAGCVAVIRAVLEADNRAERVACLLSDIVLARVLNWPTLLPVSARHLTKTVLRDLAENKSGAALSVQQFILHSIEETTRLARDLARRGTKLKAVAPKLRAQGSEAAVALFLSEDAIAPSSMLSPMIHGTTIPMTDRSARRFCDRLVELGVASELTGRSTFRLYGL